MEEEALELIKGRYPNISNKNILKIEPALFDVETVDFKSLLIEGMQLPSKFNKAVVSIKKKDIFYIGSSKKFYTKHEEFFLPIIDRLGSIYGPNNIHVVLKDFGHSRYSLNAIIVSELLPIHNLNDSGFDKAYPSVRLLNCYTSDFRPYYTVGYSFKEDEFYPLYDSHAKTIWSCYI